LGVWTGGELCIVAGGVLRLVKWKVDILTCVVFRDKVLYVQRTVTEYLTKLN